MSCANTNLPEFMMRNHVGKLPVSQKIHFQIGDTPKHIISFYRSISYTIILIKLLELQYGAAATVWRMNLGWRRRKDKSILGFNQ